MTDTIRIELVRHGDYLIGRTISDRWNLRAFNIGRIEYDRNQSAVKRLRRKLAHFGFTLSLVGKSQAEIQPSPREIEALNPPRSRTYDSSAIIHMITC